MIPAIEANTPDDIARVLGLYAQRFKGVVNKTQWLLQPGDQHVVVDEAIHKGHTFIQEDQPFLEFPVQVKTYAKHEHFSSAPADTCTFEMYRHQGAGIRLVMWLLDTIFDASQATPHWLC